MAKVLFINMEYLKSRSTIEANVDYDKVKPHILKVQELYLQQRLGSDFYNHLQSAVIAGGLTQMEETLINDYIKPMVAEYTQYEVLPFLNFKLTNKAISKQNSDNSTASELDDVKYLRNILKNNAEFYDKRLFEFLRINRDIFTIWRDWNPDENLKKRKNVYQSGVYISRDRRDDLRWYEK
jgi:hypothetical protein